MNGGHSGGGGSYPTPVAGAKWSCHLLRHSHSTAKSSTASFVLAVMATAALTLDLTEKQWRLAYRCLRRKVRTACFVRRGEATISDGSVCDDVRQWRRAKRRWSATGGEEEGAGGNERDNFPCTPLSYLLTAQSNGRRIFRATISVTIAHDLP